MALTSFIQELVGDREIRIHFACFDCNRCRCLPVEIKQGAFVDVAKLSLANNVVQLNTLSVNFVVSGRAACLQIKTEMIYFFGFKKLQCKQLP